MTQEEKEVLLKDLCARLPYGVLVQYKGHNTIIKNKLLTGSDLDCNMEYYKPYLRSMSSMTYDERKELYRLLLNVERLGFADIMFGKDTFSPVYDWLNAHHFDYRGLIPMGLSLEAKEGMYGKEEEK